MVSKIMPNFLQCCHARVTVIYTISRHRSRLGLFSSGPEPFQVRKAFTRRIMSRTVPGYSRPGMAEPNGGLSVTAYKAIIQRKKTRKGKKMFRCYHPTFLLAREGQRVPKQKRAWTERDLVLCLHAWHMWIGFSGGRK